MNKKRQTLTASFNERKLILDQTLAAQKSGLTTNLTKLNEMLESTTTTTENRLLMQLGNEIANEHPDWPDELKNYLKQADLSALLKKKNAIFDACNQLESGLKRELGTTGYNIEQFLALMERNVK